MLTRLRVLAVGIPNNILRPVLAALWDASFEPMIQRVDTPAGFEAALAAGGWDFILADPRPSNVGWLALRELLMRRTSDLPVFVVAEGLGLETAIDLARAGVADLITPSDVGRLVVSVQRELRRAEKRHTKSLG